MEKKNTSPKGHSSHASSGKKTNAKKRQSDLFLHRLLIFILVALIALGGLTGCLFFLDKNGKLDHVKNRNSNLRSSSDKKGEYYNDSSRNSTKKPTETEDFDDWDWDDEDDAPYVKPKDDTDWDDWDIEDDWGEDWGEDWGNDDYTPESESSKYTLPNNKKSDDLSGYTVILDPGHGGRDTGCVFPFNNPQYDECDFTLRIALRVKDELTSRGATVYITRTDNSWVSLYNRLAQVHLICMDIAEKQGKLPFSSSRAAELRNMLQQSIDINEDTVASGGMGLMVGSGVGEDLEDLFKMEYELDNVIFLSIHLNSSESRTLHGTQAYYVTDDSVIESEHRQMRENSEFKRSDFPIRDDYYGRDNDSNYLLACCLYDNVVGNIPEFETNAHPVLADNYAVLREHGLTGVLLETAFLSDDNDRAMLQLDSTVDDIARSVGDGIKMYFIQSGI